MASRTATITMTSGDFQGHLPIATLFKLYTYAAVGKISTVIAHCMVPLW